MLSSLQRAEKYFRVEIQQARGLGAIAAGFPERSFDDRFLAGVSP